MSKKRETRIKFYKRVQNKKIVINILYILFVLCVVFNVIYFVNTTIKEIDYFNLFGISLFSMETNLMEPEILENSLIITKKYGKNDSIEVNDKIAYSINEKVRINEVVSIETIDGKVIYHTKSNSQMGTKLTQKTNQITTYLLREKYPLQWRKFVLGLIRCYKVLLIDGLFLSDERRRRTNCSDSSRIWIWREGIS